MATLHRSVSTLIISVLMPAQSNLHACRHGECAKGQGGRHHIRPQDRMPARLCEPICKEVNKFRCAVRENALLHAQRPAGHVGAPSFAPGRHGLQGPGACGRSKRSTHTTTQRSYWRRRAYWFEQHKNLGTTADVRLHRCASHVTSPHVLPSVSGCGCLASCAPTCREQRH